MFVGLVEIAIVLCVDFVNLFRYLNAVVLLLLLLLLLVGDIGEGVYWVNSLRFILVEDALCLKDVFIGVWILGGVVDRSFALLGERCCCFDLVERDVIKRGLRWRRVDGM